MANPPEGDPETPFGLSWRAIYGIVLGALVLEIVIFAVVTRLYQ